MYAILCLLVLPALVSSQWAVDFSPTQLLEMKMSETALVNFTANLTTEESKGYVYLYSDNTGVALVSPENIDLASLDINNNIWSSSFNVTANFIGYDNIRMVLKVGDTEKFSDPLHVTVIRNKRPIDTLFVICVVILMSIVFINFGCALDFDVIQESLRRPIGPAIGCVTNFIFMPVISFVIGRMLFPTSVPMQLGFFFTGISPSGGASNVWTIVLKGNLNLSLTMTTVSTLAAFFMMPLWVFTLGRIIFDQGSLIIPYSKITQSAVSLLIPLCIGFAIQKYRPKAAKLMVRILKPLSAVVILFIVVFATVTNLYLFKLFTWQILMAGLALPFFGYLSGAILSKIANLKLEDAIAITVESGVQNTGIAIFMLQFSLGQPEADLTTVAPVAVALFTPVPLICLYVFQRMCCSNDLERRSDGYI